MSADTARTANPAGRTLAGLLVLGFVVGLLAFQVKQGEVAVVTTFGRPVRPIDQPGLRLKLPWPIQSVHRFDGRLQSFAAPARSALSSDKKPLVVELYAAWRIADPLRFLERDGSRERAESWLERELTSQAGAAVGRMTLTELFAAEGFGALESSVLTAVQPTLEAYGVSVEQVGLRRLSLPESVTTAVFERMKQERERAARQLLAEGEKEAGEVRAAADEAYEKAVGGAEAEALKLRGDAERAAAESYRVLGRNPDLAAFLQETEALPEVLGDKDTVVVDADSPVLRVLRGENAP